MPINKTKYQKYSDLLNQLIGEIGEDEKHPLASLLNFVGVQIANYEKCHYPEPDASPQEVLASLM